MKFRLIILISGLFLLCHVINPVIELLIYKIYLHVSASLIKD